LAIVSSVSVFDRAHRQDTSLTTETKAESLNSETKVCERRLLFIVQKSDRARIDAVVATDYLYLTGIDLGLEDGRGCTQSLHNIFHVGFRGHFDIPVDSSYDCGPDCLDERFDVARCLPLAAMVSLAALTAPQR
jgi:hypothetical protein